MRSLFPFLLAALVWSWSNFAAESPSFKTADEFWAHIQQLQKGPQQEPQSEEEARRLARDFLQEFEATLAKFIETYPSDPRRWDAMIYQAQVLLTRDLVESRNPAKNAAAQEKLRQVAGAMAAPVMARANASFVLIQLHGSALGAAPDKEPVAALDSEMTEFIKRFPEDPRVSFVRLMRAEMYGSVDPAKSESLLQELLSDRNPHVAERARAKLAQLQLMRKPLELKYTAVDGREVDLSKMRGKVVLVDFWATWCAPCRREVPNVVAAYQKYRDKGFEVVGISLDEDKEAMIAYTKEHGMTWPQHCDGKGWHNEISTRFGVQSIPAMWLVDKKGMIRSTDARGEQLAVWIEKLLKE
ncbi:MAG: TlpA family protein disulfide reductase [Verrucomicrobiae bacterium]|nr:TlpA family protein disulfide reductase [Verrucomicrobiae bacterium]